MKAFLSARWLNLINITYAVNPDLLIPYLPQGVELDIIQGKAFISLVPFQFLNTRFLGIRVPQYQNFSELNMRFYVHDRDHSGVVFIREFAPGYCMNAIANTFYHEHYTQAHIHSSIQEDGNEIEVSYCIEKNGIPHYLSAKAFSTGFIPDPGSREYFLEHRFYGFSRNKKGETYRFRVAHPEWELYTLYDYTVQLDFHELFGRRFGFLGHQDPVSAMLIKGSEVEMFPLQAVNDKDPVLLRRSPLSQLLKR